MNQFTWSLGIGDPTIGGWVTVALYLTATVSCWITMQRLADNPKERRAWLSVLFLVLAINKQLDLQSALTEIGRILARRQHWYAQRQEVQIIVVGVLVTAAIVVLLTLIVWARRLSGPTLLALVGIALVIGYVLIRAASFHHIDRFIGRTLLGFRWNWIIEMGGITVVILESIWRRGRLMG